MMSVLHVLTSPGAAAVSLDPDRNATDNAATMTAALARVLGAAGAAGLAASHTLVDGEDFSWLWDVDVESITPHIEDVVCSGNRPDELAMRLKYAEVPPDKISNVHEREAGLDAALKNTGPGGTLYIMASYTPTNELLRIMQKRGWVRHFWEE